MISLRSFCKFPSCLLGAVACVWLYAAGASMVAFPVLAQDQAGPPAAAPESAPQPRKKDTQTELTVSGAISEAGSTVTFTAVVTGVGGVPAGIVTFKAGGSVLHSTELSAGS